MAQIEMSAIEMVHGSAGATVFGASKHMWSPAEAGTAFDKPGRRPVAPNRGSERRMAQIYSARRIARYRASVWGEGLTPSSSRSNLRQRANTRRASARSPPVACIFIRSW